MGLNITNDGRPECPSVCAFYGIGAYTAAILATRYGVPFWATSCWGGRGRLWVWHPVPTLRLKGIFLALVTIGFQESFFWSRSTGPA